MKYLIKGALGNRVLVKLDMLEKTTAETDDKTMRMTKGGLLIPENSKLVQDEDRRQEGAETGTVVSIGYMAYQGLGDGRPWVKLGDRVGFKRYAGIDPYPHGSPDGYKYRAMDDEDIVFSIDQEEEIVND